MSNLCCKPTYVLHVYHQTILALHNGYSIGFLSFYLLVFCRLERKFKLYGLVLYLQIFGTKFYYFQNLSLGFILKIFLKFRKFHPQYSYKIYS